ASKEKKAKGSEETAKGSIKKILGRKRAGKQQQQESSKKQKMEEDKESDEVDEVDEVSKDDEEELLKHLLIRTDGSSKRYSSMMRMLQGIDREDLEVLWRIVKAKHNDTRPEDEFERVNLKIQKLNIKFRGGLLRLERLQGHLRFLLHSTVSMKLLLPVEVKTAQITTVSIKISTAGTYYCLCSVSAAGYKDTTVADLQLLEDLLLSRG
ncbi:hypothetical protein Tco_1451871, partial [Tanacetum coccineum]